MILTCRRNYKIAYLKNGSGTECLFHSPKELQRDKAETLNQLPSPLSQTILLPLLRNISVERHSRQQAIPKAVSHTVHI